MNISNDPVQPLSLHTSNDALRQLLVMANANITFRKFLLEVLEEAETVEDYKKALTEGVKVTELVIASALNEVGIPVSFDENPQKPSSKN